MAASKQKQNPRTINVSLSITVKTDFMVEFILKTINAFCESLSQHVDVSQRVEIKPIDSKTKKSA